MSFSALGLDPKILQAVKEAGYTEPTPIQTAAIPPILAGHDLIGIAQTGTGKTAAFTLPMLTKLAATIGDGRQRGTRALVLAPTRELVLQIEENVKAYGKHLPLRVATALGLVMALAGLVGIGWVLWLRMTNQGPTFGWGSLMAALLVFSGAQLVMLGLIGEYIGRTFLTVNKRPQATLRTVVKSDGT